MIRSNIGRRGFIDDPFTPQYLRRWIARRPRRGAWHGTLCVYVNMLYLLIEWGNYGRAKRAILSKTNIR